MKIFFIHTILIILLASKVFASENIINVIKIEGTQRIDIETVISYSKIVEGDVYSEELGNIALKNLFETNLFSNIKISFNDNILNITITENPTINLVSFKGNSKVKDEDLIIEISLKERSVYSRSKVKKDIQRMLTLYQRSGRLSTEIDPKLEILENNRVNLVYEITESDVAKVSKIIVLGNKQFSSSKIKSIMKTKENTFLRILSSSDNYDPDKLEYDKQLITQFYNNNGYPEFKFVSSIAQLKTNSNDFEIILNINEGDEFKFGKLSVESMLKKINAKAIQDILPINEGDVFDRSKIRDSIDELKELAQLEGYTFIDIDANLVNDDKLKTVDINLLIFQ